ncbi:hypothetical protein [Rhizobium sp. Leaf386]|uniref:hypothetical protein n=1 Tax=Rhizobium sp. Leaf386 TaxID=1736359 RepID=UPI0007133BD9|nr:hypothetical protein [Rhizobium sp. Leaf386]KQS90302.1 hypothetical protein ASG50_07545 [Rhizobium sp. Leaf386]
MTHARHSIRDHVQTMLAGSPDAGARVLPRRSLPLPDRLQPTLVFNFMDEQSQDISMGGSQERRGRLMVRACVKGDSGDSEDVLDRLAVWTELRFADDPTLGGLISTYEYQSTEFAVAGEGDKTLSIAAFIFALTYYTQRDNPQASH